MKKRVTPVFLLLVWVLSFSSLKGASSPGEELIGRDGEGAVALKELGYLLISASVSTGFNAPCFTVWGDEDPSSWLDYQMLRFFGGEVLSCPSGNILFVVGAGLVACSCPIATSLNFTEHLWRVGLQEVGFWLVLGLSLPVMKAVGGDMSYCMGLSDHTTLVQNRTFEDCLEMTWPFAPSCALLGGGMATAVRMRAKKKCNCLSRMLRFLQAPFKTCLSRKKKANSFDSNDGLDTDLL